MTIELTLSGTDVTDTTPINAITEDAHRLSLERPDLLLLTSFLTVLTSSSSSSKRLAKRFSEDCGIVSYRNDNNSIKQRGEHSPVTAQHVPFYTLRQMQTTTMLDSLGATQTHDRSSSYLDFMVYEREGFRSVIPRLLSATFQRVWSLMVDRTFKDKRILEFAFLCDMKWRLENGFDNTTNHPSSTSFVKETYSHKNPST